VVNGARWLDVRSDELVHFVCRPDKTFRVGLDSVSMLVYRLLKRVLRLQ